MSAGFCTLCGFNIESFDGLSGCPRCGTMDKPCSTSDQVEVSVNIHELRVLCIWAERWATLPRPDGQDVPVDLVYGIALRLRRQLREKGKDNPLTMADEIQALRDAGYDVDVIGAGGDRP